MVYSSSALDPKHNQRNFALVDFIDTPGLTDGHLQYMFDVNGIIVWLAERADIILVFFDPHGYYLFFVFALAVFLSLFRRYAV